MKSYLFQDYENYSNLPDVKYTFRYTSLSTDERIQTKIEVYGLTTTYFLNINSLEDLSED